MGPQYPPGSGDPSGSVYLLGEGNFGWGNAALSVYDPTTQSVSQNTYQAVNGQPLGDVAQSMTSIDGHFYVVVNNSGKVDVLDTASLQLTGSITGLNSPRYIAAHGGKLFVSDLYANAVAVVDQASLQVTGSIPVGQWSEEMLVWQNKLFVSLPGDSIVLHIDPATETILDTLVLSPGPGRAVIDSNDKLWVLCSDALYRIDPVTLAIEQSLGFTSGASPSRLRRSGYGDTLFWVDSDVYAMSSLSGTLPASPTIDLQGISVYAMGIDPANNEVYITNAGNFTQQSEVYRYSSTGTLIDQFQGPIICGDVAFK